MNHSNVKKFSNNNINSRNSKLTKKYNKIQSGGTFYLKNNQEILENNIKIIKEIIKLNPSETSGINYNNPFSQVYKSLVLIIHPDKHQDPSIKKK